MSEECVSVGPCVECEGLHDLNPDGRCAVCYAERSRRLDLFAAAALTGLLARGTDDVFANIALDAWNCAFFMLEQEKEQPGE